MYVPRRARAGIAFVLAGLIALLPSVTLAQQQIDHQTNVLRRENGLRRLPTNDNLIRLARMRARQISRNWGHNFAWMSQTRCSWAGENIAYRNPPPDSPARWLFEVWRDSKPHLANMLGDFDRMGSAIFFAPNGGMYGVQLFCEAGS